jgi:hypothetical protein
MDSYVVVTYDDEGVMAIDSVFTNEDYAKIYCYQNQNHDHNCLLYKIIKAPWKADPYK